MTMGLDTHAGAAEPGAVFTEAALPEGGEGGYLRAYFGHHKCASRWIISITGEVCDVLSMRWREFDNAEAFNRNLALTVRADDIDFVCYSNANATYLGNLEPYRGFHVVRDPRDIAVSAYFSHMYSHPSSGWPALVEHRESLVAMTEEDGLIREMEFSRNVFDDMNSWDYGRPHVLELKLEHLSDRPLETFAKIWRFLGAMGEDTGSGLQGEVLRDIVHRNRFEAKAGRPRGEEDITSHYRKGVSGDWVNHFGSRAMEYFKAQHNDLLLKLGYESEEDWGRPPGPVGRG